MSTSLPVCRELNRPCGLAVEQQVSEEERAEGVVRRRVVDTVRRGQSVQGKPVDQRGEGRRRRL
jgi:hypothetical protein